MAMLSEAKKSRAQEDDHISRLPEAILGEIVSLLPTKDGGRTQVLSSRWRHLWRSAPLNIDLHELEHQGRRIRPDELSGLLSSHRGPGRRFSIPSRCFDDERHPAATLEGWLRSPALDGLQELDFHYMSWFSKPIAPAPASALRFSSTLRVASFSGCIFPDGNAAGALHLPLLEKLSLLHVRISESSLYALLAGCPVLQSLLLTDDNGCSRLRIVSHTLRSICVRSGSGWGETTRFQQLIIEDAPCLQRLLLSRKQPQMEFVLSVISAPRLKILGQLPEDHLKLEFGFGSSSTMVFQGSRIVNSTMPKPNVKVLALTHGNLSLDVVIDFIKCFPCLESLYIKTAKLYIEPANPAQTNAWCRKYRNLISTLDIRLKKVVVTTYRGNRAHVNFAKFFVLNARVLESMVFDIKVRNDNKEWIERQHALLKLEDRASRSAWFDFVSHSITRPSSLDHIWSEQVHDLSTTDPFVRFNVWT